jgi:hypothetical protein
MAARMEKVHNVTGHVRLVKRARGSKWYAKYRLPDGRVAARCASASAHCRPARNVLRVAERCF